MRSSKIFIVAGLVLQLLVCLPAYSALLAYEFIDPAGDTSRTTFGTDITRISIVFDNSTGDYTITLRAAPGTPFTDWFRFNLNMVNPDTPQFVEAQSYFFDNLNDVRGYPALQSYSKSGNAPSLLLWQAGDRVAMSSDPFGIATDIPVHAFGSGFTDWSQYPATGQTSSDDFSRSDVAVISAVPVPAALWLFTSGLFVLAGIARRGKRIISPES